LIQRWWPPAALLTLVALGLLVGQSSTPLDDWFLTRDQAVRSVCRPLLIVVDTRVLGVLWAATVAYALWQRRWLLAAVAVVLPPAGVLAARLLKMAFGRSKGGALAYPSGHMTVLACVLGMLVLAAGCRFWALLAAALVALLGMLGLSVTFHYFTDTVGAVLLASALVCLAAGAIGSPRAPT